MALMSPSKVPALRMEMRGLALEGVASGAASVLTVLASMGASARAAIGVVGVLAVISTARGSRPAVGGATKPADKLGSVALMDLKLSDHRSLHE